MQNQLILASSSPRRIQLLNDCKISFKAVDHLFNEDSIEHKNPVKLAKLLSYNKALSIAKKPEYNNMYVLGVDTLVVVNNIVLGKPLNKEEAKKFILMLSNKTHKVISGISIINIKKSLYFTKKSVSKVRFIKINEKFIKYYLDINLWEGYAGGYAIQESIFNLVVKKIKGSYSNIVGLPVNVFYRMLKNINYNFLVW